MKKIIILFFLTTCTFISYGQAVITPNKFSDDFNDGVLNSSNDHYWYTGSAYSISESNGQLEITANQADQFYTGIYLDLFPQVPIDIQNSKTVSFKITNQGTDTIVLRVDLRLNDPMFMNTCMADSFMYANHTPGIQYTYYTITVLPGETKNARLDYTGAKFEYGWQCGQAEYYEIQDFSDITGLFMVINGSAGESWCTFGPQCSLFTGTVLIDDLAIGGPINPSIYNRIHGKVFDDKNKDCIQQADEPGLSHYLIQALPGPYYANTNADGEYELYVDTGSYACTVQQLFSPVMDELTNQICPATSHTVNLSGSGQDVCCYNFANEIRQCHRLEVDIESTRRRRCFRNQTRVSYVNKGNLAALGATVKVEFPEYVIPVTSSPPWNSLVENVATYEIGSVNAFSGGVIFITDSVVCFNEAIRNLTQCTKATISPANKCTTEDPSWDRSSINVQGQCANDSVIFTITNTGSDMQDSSEYRVFVNDTLIYSANFILKKEEAFMVSIPGEGNTIRLEADQRPYHPGYSRPRSTIEACGGDMATAERFIVTTSPQDDLDEHVSISCLPIIDSYDPNDKNAAPAGYLDDHFIKTTTDKIEYTIRFQNTGSDTAFTVVIKDTLDPNLDISTLQVGPASHNFTWKLSGIENTHLVFTFNNILLPDSTTNNPGSNGFVKFAISPKQGLAEGVQISNKAEIYFDYNSAVITNTYVHTFSNQVFEDKTRTSQVVEGKTFALNPGVTPSYIEVYPNPVTNTLYLKQNTGGASTIIIFTAEGKKILEKTLSGSSSAIDVSSLEQGAYIYEVKPASGTPVKGRFVKM